MAAAKKGLPKELEGVATSDDLSKLENRVETLEKQVGTTAAIVSTLENVFKNDRNIDPIMTSYIGEHINLDPLIEKTVKKQDREWWKSAGKNGVKWAGAVILALISGLAGYFIRGND